MLSGTLFHRRIPESEVHVLIPVCFFIFADLEWLEVGEDEESREVKFQAKEVKGGEQSNGGGPVQLFCQRQ